jgi:acetoacetyl-CoA synthetase
MEKQGIAPKDHFALTALEAVILAGSPSTPAAFEWVWNNIGNGLWISSQSGGTEFCSGLLGGVPERGVVPGQIQGASLGVSAYAFDDDGKPIIGQPGELVLTKPMPSMPIRLWGDEDYNRYREAYFHRWPHVWVHGDSCQFNEDGTCFVFGRSDATLNRYGIRIGSAEIYRTVDGIKGVADSLVICIEEEGGGYFMPLFVALAPGVRLDDALKNEIVRRLRTERSPRHVPDVIIEAPGIPQTITGKRMEVPVRKLLMGVAPAKAYSPEASKSPAIMEWFVEFAGKRLADRTTKAS